MNSFWRSVFVLAWLGAGTGLGFAQGSAFTYQGRLAAGTNPASGQYEMSFTLYDAATNGSVVGAGQTVAPVAVSNGLFTVTLDFGPGVFNGGARWLEISVNLFGSDMIPTVLAPRQRILPSPYAIHAANAAGLMTFVDAPLDIKVNGQRALRLEPTSPVESQITGAPNVIGGSSANVVSYDVTGATIAGGGAVSLAGTDVRNSVQSTFATIGGGMSNSIFGDAGGATIAGGMRNTILWEGVYSTIGGGFLNLIDDDAGAATIAGGRENLALNNAAAIGGGWGNRAGAYATVAGGQNNQGLSAFAAIGGGNENQVLGGGYGTVGGGSGNVAGAGSEPNFDHAYATIGGGLFNRSAGDYSTIGGGYLNFGTNEGTTVAGGFVNTASNTYATVGGGVYNFVHAYGATIAGGGFNTIERGEASGSYSVIGGGAGNLTIGDHATIAGGHENLSEGSAAVVGGGRYNFSSGRGATVGGGTRNVSWEAFATVAGGVGNNALGFASFVGGGGGGVVGDDEIPVSPNIAAGDWSVATGGAANRSDGAFATVSGGRSNVIDGADAATLGGGEANRIESRARYATIGGGLQNAIAVDAGAATIAGGANNRIEGDPSGDDSFSAIGGGSGNVVRVGARFVVIAGGAYNVIETNAELSAILGGYQNLVAQPYSVAAGRGAQALHAGAFVWADATLSGVSSNASLLPFPTTATNEFAARATGGVRFVTAVDSAGLPTAGATLAPGSGAWSTLSDRHAKENVFPADTREILERVAALPLATWNYKSQEKSIRHIGPMAQDFRAAFAVGESDRTITTVDADGVALAAIQGLNQKVEEENRALRAALKSQDREIEELREALTELRNRIGGR